jgi:isoleucyl-tRNA synthetase
MPHRAGDDERNILFNEMNKPFTDYALDSETMAKWDTLIRVREDVNGVLEQARADKRIGKALEARVHLLAQDSAAKAALNEIRRMDLAELFIVSACTGGTDLIPEAAEDGVTAQGSNFPGMLITVSEAQGTKCPRCWMHSLNADAEGLCPRCAAVVARLETEI